MLVGVASIPSSFPPTETYAFYSRNRQNCVSICKTVYYNIAKKKPLKIFEFAVPQIQKSNLDWSDNNQGVTIGNHNIQANHGDYWVFTWIWFDSDCSRKNETTHHFSFRQKQVIEPRQSLQRPETFFYKFAFIFK